MTDITPDVFVCPECGGSEAALHMHVRPLSTDTSPWGTAHARVVCASCHRVIPTFLAERWNDRPLEEARAAWRLLFREHPQSGPLSPELLRRLLGEPGQIGPNRIEPGV